MKEFNTFKDQLSFNSNQSPKSNWKATLIIGGAVLVALAVFIYHKKLQEKKKEENRDKDEKSS